MGAFQVDGPFPAPNPDADAAAMRRAFYEAVASFPVSVSKYLDRSDAGREQLALLMSWWDQFNKAIRDHTAGLKLLAELAEAKGK